MDDTIHFEEMTPLKSRRRIDFNEEKSSSAAAGKALKMTSKDSKTGMKTVPSEMFRLQESVRMIVTPLMDVETAAESVVISPAIDVHQAVTVRQRVDEDMSSTSRVFASIATNHMMAMDALQSSSNNKTAEKSTEVAEAIHHDSSDSSKQLLLQQIQRPRPKKAIGHHKTIVECSASSSSPSTDESRRFNIQQTAQGLSVQGLSSGKMEKRSMKTYSSPESPLSKMSVMPNPRNDKDDFNLSLQNQSLLALEIPTPERLLPIGPQEGVSTIVERMRQCLKIPDISHLKEEESSIDVLSDSTKDELTPSSRANSPRRLIKQVALEEPLQFPASTANALNAAEQQQQQQQPLHDSCKSILKMVSAGGGGKAAAAAAASFSNGGGEMNGGSSSNRRSQIPASANNKTNNNGVRRAGKKPRQKMVPFNIDLSNTMDLRSRYAGSWPPPQFQQMQQDEQHLEDFSNDLLDNETSQSQTGQTGQTGNQQQILNRVVKANCLNGVLFIQVMVLV